jgi:hypothetical protein
MNKDKNEQESRRGKDANRDPISGAPGAHPVGTGIGATGGAVAGAAIGSVAGPVGAGIGLAAGAVVGGLAGKGVAEKIDPTVEDRYWQENYPTRPYAEREVPYEEYQPAYRTGYEGYGRYSGKKYEEVEADLQREYEQSKGHSKVGWDKAKYATQDAWHRVERTYPVNDPEQQAVDPDRPERIP